MAATGFLMEDCEKKRLSSAGKGHPAGKGAISLIKIRTNEEKMYKYVAPWSKMKLNMEEFCKNGQKCPPDADLSFRYAESAGTIAKFTFGGIAFSA